MLEVNHFGEWFGLIVIVGKLEFIAAKIACFKYDHADIFYIRGQIAT